MKAELVPTDGGTPIPITRDVTVIGRREFCDVQIESPSLSKRHAAIVRTDGLLIVRDLASTNGTKVNGQRVMWAALLPNDRLTLGRCKFKVYLGPDHAPSPSERHQGTRPPRASEATPRVPRPVVATLPQGRTPEVADSGFAPPTPLGVPIPSIPRNTPGSTDSDSEIEDLGQFILDEEDEVFVIDLD